MVKLNNKAWVNFFFLLVGFYFLPILLKPHKIDLIKSKHYIIPLIILLPLYFLFPIVFNEEPSHIPIVAGIINHGLDILGLDRLLIFNNGGPGAGQGSSSLAIEFQLDLNSMMATQVWEYGASAGISNQVMGDVQRLDNGNTLVTYSIQGVVHEVDQNGSLLQELSWGSGAAIGYSMKRQSLYGPPPK